MYIIEFYFFKKTIINWMITVSIYVHINAMYQKIQKDKQQTDNNGELGRGLGWEMGWPKRTIVFAVFILVQGECSYLLEQGIWTPSSGFSESLRVKKMSHAH